MGKRRTLSMDPQERTLCVPFLKSVALDEPFCGSTVMSSKGNIVVLGWIWRGEPTSHVLLQLVTCETRSLSATFITGMSQVSRLNLFISFVIPCIVTSIQRQSHKHWLSTEHTKSLPYVIHRCLAIYSDKVH